MNQLTLLFLLAASSVYGFNEVINFGVESLCPADRWMGVDLVWAMDASSSVGLKRYQSGIDFMKAITLLFKGHIGDGADQSRMALYEFDEIQNTKFELDSFNTADQIAECIQSLRDQDQNGSMNTLVGALNYARTELFNKARPGAKKVLVFVADGWTDETADEISAASKTARDSGIEIWFIGYKADISGVKANAVVGGDASKISYEHEFSDVNKFTGCKPEVTVPSSTIDCINGVASCEQCRYPFFGDHCDKSIQCDNVPIILHGKMVHPHFCHGHGNCTNVEGGGAYCTCDKCWTGEFCQDYDSSCANSDRCILYETEKTLANPDLIQYMCDLTTERCVPDNMDCALNVETKEVDGKRVCQPHPPKTACKCPYPTGWCIPLPAAKRVINAIAVATKAYIDPFFLGSS